MTGNLSLGDNVKATFGASDDLELYHDGNNSYINDTGTGALLIRGNNVALAKYTGETMVNAFADGRVDLYYDNAIKLTTTTTGIDVTGTVTADGLTVDGSLGSFAVQSSGAEVHFSRNENNDILANGGTSASFTIGANNNLTFKTGATLTQRLQIASNGNLSLYEDTGTTPKFFWDASAESLGIGTSSPVRPLSVKGSQEQLTLSEGDARGATFDYRSSTGNLNIATNGINARTNPQFTLDLNGNVGIGTSSPAAKLQVEGETRIYPASGTAILRFGSGGVEKGRLSVDASSNMAFETANTERMRIAASGNVGIGTSTPASPTGFGTGGILHLKGSTGNDCSIVLEGISGSGGRQEIGASGGALQFYRGAATGSMSESMRIDASGNLLVGKTASSFSVAGIGLMANDQIFATATSDNSLALNRLTTDGDIAKFYKDGSTVGSIGTAAGNLYIVSNDVGLNFAGGGDGIYPATANGAQRDAAIDLGASSHRFKDLYLSGGLRGDTLTFGNLAGTERMRINSSGNVLLQTGGAALQWQNGYQTISGAADSNDLTYRTYANHIWKTTTGASSTTDGTERMRIEAGGQVVLTAPTPSIKMIDSDDNSAQFIQGYGGGLGYYADDNNAISNSFHRFFIDGTEKVRIDSSGRVGIGTSSPSAKLDVNSGGSGNTASFKSGAANVNEYAGITIHTQTISNDDWYGSEIRSINTGGTPNVLNPRLGFFTQDIGTYLPANRTEKMSILGNGNVGIGTDSPSQKLHVSKGGTNVGAVDYDVAVFQNGDAAGIRLVDAGDGGGNGGHSGLGNDNGNLRVSSAGVMTFATGLSTSDYLFNGGTERMRIDSAGNLGLGVTPSAWLSGYKVFEMPQLSLFSGGGGGGFLLGNAYLNSSAQFIYKVSGLAATSYNNQGGSHVFSIAPSGTAGSAISFTQAMTLDSAGRVGIGTSSTNGLKTAILGATGYPATSGTTQTGVFRISGGTGLYNVLDMGVNEATDTAWMQATRANSLGTYDKLVINPYGGSVGIGTSSPNSYAGQTTLNINSAGVARLDLDIGNTIQGFLLAESGYTGLLTPSGSNYLILGTNDTERMRILADGSVVQGNTASLVASNYNNQAGAAWHKPDEHYEIATTGNRSPLEIGKNNANDGSLVVFRKQSNVVGSIGTGGALLGIGGGTGNLGFFDATIVPMSDTSGGGSDGVVNLGTSARRFKDLYLSGTIALTTADNASAANIFVSPSTDFLYLEHPSNGMIFRNTSGTERMRIDSSGAATFSSSVAADGQITSARGSDTGTYGFRHEGAGKYMRMGVANASFAYFETDADAGFSFEGNVTVPNQILHAGDTDTYMQFHAANEWRVVAGGYERFAIGTNVVVNEDSHDSDFRVESDGNSHMLFVDGGNNAVGIGMSTPLEPLHATGRILSTTTYGGSTQRIGTSIGQNGNTRADIDFRRWTGASTNHGVGMIDVADTGIMRFYVDSVTSNTPATTERISLDPTGAFTTTPAAGGHAVFNEGGVDADFRVESDGNANMLFVDGGNSHIGMGTATLNRSGLGADHIVLTVGADTEMGMLELQGTRTSDADLGRISFLNAGTRRAEIVAARIDADNSTKLYFQTSDAGSLGTRLTIGKDGAATFNSSVSTGGDIILPSTGKLYSSGDTDSFLQFNQPNTLRAIIGDSTRMIIEPNTTVFNEDSADVDFRVESDNDANAFFVQGSNGFVGIGTGSPVSITGAAGPILDMQGPNPEIVFHDNDGTANAMSMYYLNDTLRWWGDGAQNMSLDNSGNLTVAGALSKGSGSFKIDHPLPAKTETHNLVHSFIEGPQADNIYRGKVTLVDGSATVNIDTVSGMSEGTYVLLNTNTQCFTSNESGWTAVKGSVAGNILTIEAQESCSDTISWMVVGERHDQHMLDTEWTDENGKVIVEPLKELES
jgi:hypothetical protein